MPLVAMVPWLQLNILQVQKGHKTKPNLGHNHCWCNIVSRKKVQDTIILIKFVRFCECVCVCVSVRPSLQ